MEPLKLAVQIDSKFVDRTIDTAIADERWDLIRAAVSIISDPAVTSSDQSVQSLVSRIGRAIVEEPSSVSKFDSEKPLTPAERLGIGFPNFDDSGWGWTVTLCKLRLQPNARQVRNQILDNITDKTGLIARSLAVITDATTDERSLSPDEFAARSRSIEGVDRECDKFRSGRTRDL